MAHDVKDYYIGKGVVSFTPTGGVKRDLGNVPEFEVTPEIEKIDHFSSRTGVRTKDRSEVLAKSMTVRIVMENHNADNLAMVLLGTNTAGTIEVFDQEAITGELEFAGGNSIGPDITMTLFNVSFLPGSSLNLIGDDWGTIELTGEVLIQTGGANDGRFGEVVVVPEA